MLLADSQAAKRLAGWRSQPGMLGLRFNFKRTPQTLASGDADWVWGVAEKAGVPIYVGVSHDNVHVIDAIAQRHPALRLIFDHMALSTGAKDEVAFRDLDKLLAAAKRPNVALKISALPCYTDAAYPYRNLTTVSRGACFKYVVCPGLSPILNETAAVPLTPPVLPTP
jgi:predicted TIM-barrel fold metal-dependent hydrolase